MTMLPVQSRKDVTGWVKSLSKMATAFKDDSDLADFNYELAELQKLIGVETGDFAGQYFSALEDTWHTLTDRDRYNELVCYMQREMAQLMPDWEV